MAELNEKHVADLRSSGLTDETIASSQCYSADPATTRGLLGFGAGPGVVFPYPGTENGTGAPYIRVKPDVAWSNGDGRPAKYLSAKGSGNHLYVPPNFPSAALEDSTVRLIVTEGEKKALAGCQDGFPTIALPGVACWVARNGDGASHPIADLDRITWTGREVVIAFDSDAATKVTVRREAEKLGRELQSRGAEVRIARIHRPKAEEDHEHQLSGKFGMDDFLKVRGKSAFEGVLGRAARLRELKQRKDQVLTADLAQAFLCDRGWLKGDVLLLHWWRGEFYLFNGTHYGLLARGDLRAQVNKWLQESTDYRALAGSRVATAITENIEAMALVNAAQEPPIWLSAESCRGEAISLSNGLIDIGDLLGARYEVLRPHTPEYFATSSLPFPLEPNANCSRWVKFLDEMVPDPDVQALLCEMFGYLTVYDTSQEAFFLFEGTGANGKTVVCTVLREILGPSNVSAVSLEAFSAARTFPLAATIGKKANIVEELEEVHKAAEGMIKNFVTAKPMTIERKNRDAFEFTPTARLVFATNVLPRFIDRTEGIWRRLMVIPFRQQILDRSKQDRRLIDPMWWRESGELPGIFQWALAGLSALRSRGHFIEPEACRERKDTYRQESNPAGQFLAEFCEAGLGFQVSSRTLYSKYKTWAEDCGFRPLSVNHFAGEIRRAFPAASLSANPLRIDGTRSRAWSGLRYVGDE